MPATKTKYLTDKQCEFVENLRSRKYRFLLFGGGTGGGKSYLGAQLFINLAMTQPGTTYGVFRKSMTTLRRTTLRTFQKYAAKNRIREGRDYIFNQKDMTWTFIKSGSVIYFMELNASIDPEFIKLGGLELTAAMIDEANEVAEAGFDTLRFRVGRNNFNGELDFIYLTCNPNQTWVRRLFYDKARKGTLKSPYYFLESLITDNTFQSDAALAAAADPTAPPQFVQRFFKGNWDYIFDDHALIQLQQLHASQIEVAPINPKNMYVGFDPSREGKDQAVIACWADDTLIDLLEVHVDKSDDSPISNLLGQALIDYCAARNIPAHQVAVDAVGNGGGVVDYCRGKKFFVREFKSGRTDGVELFEDGGKRYNNIRSQSYWKMSRELEAKTKRVVEALPFAEELEKDLLAHKWSSDEKMLIVDSKDFVKENLLGRSPDYSDAAMMGYWVMVQPRVGGRVISGGSYKSTLYKRKR